MSDELRAPNRQPAADSGAVLMTKLTPPPVRVGLVPRARIAAMLVQQSARRMPTSVPTTGPPSSAAARHTCSPTVSIR
ncbi:hypothetical protein K2Z83_18670 [Oscillochloris sp. ZM17-4]|uniref:hypothetical protein n=1 Tax=Oscillochloris sp. ZM17-4 TaxID=2866714 RepID=UPI001C73CEC1|nr:hypothetical protein [Oscillochloris sp. ZM17-4]MBX0329698.1 hypothetical protein [Oscillochloris sp. ZM17-4]